MEEDSCKRGSLSKQDCRLFLISPSGIQKDGRSATIDFLKLVACDANMEAEAFVCS